MRYAIFSDIHGNLPAWKAVLRDMRALEVDVYVCLGDVVGYGPKPQEVLDGIRAVTSNFVVGNHDAAAAGILDASIFNAQAREVIEWTRNQLSSDAINYLREAPLVIGDEGLSFVHAEMEAPGRFCYIDSEEEARANFQAAQAKITFVGHTHHPCVFVENRDGSVQKLADDDRTLDGSRRYIINVGSVGEPRNPRDIRARYVIYDDDTRAVSFRRIDFDVEAYRSELGASGLSVTPYFLRVVDHRQEALAESRAAGAGHAMMVDMQTASIRPVAQSNVRRQLVVPSPVAQRNRRKPRVLATRGRRRSPVVLVTLINVLLIAVVGFLIWFGQSDRGGEELVVDERRTVVASEEAPMITGAAGAETREVDAPLEFEPPLPELPPVPAGETAGSWHFDEPDDATGEPALTPIEVGQAVEPLIDPVPSSGAANAGAVRGGAWQEAEVSGWFGFAADRSFTFECWYSAATPEREVEFVAGNRSDPSDGLRGWELICSSSEPGAFLFTYDPGGRGGSIDLSFPVDGGFDEKPHHLALVWDAREGGGDSEGELTFFFDGEESASVRIPLGLIPGEPARKKFSLGGTGAGTDDRFRGSLDEARFSMVALEPAGFLFAAREEVVEPETAPEMPALPPSDVIAYWRMDDPGDSPDLADSAGGFPLSHYDAWSATEPLAPDPVPLTFEENKGAAKVRLLGGLAEGSGAFALKLDSGFTYEGWFDAGSEKQVTLGTTLNGDEREGWRVALLRGDGGSGFAAFMYENGEKKVQALGRDVTVFDDRAHHFAAVWDPGATSDAGRLAIFIDREQVGTAMLPHADIAGGKSNPFQVGTPENELSVDELRFSSAALTPERFLTTGDTILFDFEDETFDGWTVEGSAFGSKPAGGQVTATKAFSGRAGKLVAHSSHGGDGPTGKMTSAAFKITHRYLRFLVAGGIHEGKTYVGLEIDGKLVHSTTGHENLDFFEELWDLSSYANKEAKFVAVDDHGGRWGVIAFDHVVLTDHPGSLTP